MKPYSVTDVAKRIGVGAGCLGAPVVIFLGLAVPRPVFDSAATSRAMPAVAQRPTSSAPAENTQVAVPARPDQRRDGAIEDRPEALAAAASTALRDGDYDLAIVLLSRAIRINKDDVGAWYAPRAFARPDGPNHEHGERQLKQMLIDRPVMAAYLNPTDELWRWAAAKFAARVDGSEINWDSTRTSDWRAFAEHEVPWQRRPGRIRVSNVNSWRPGPGRPKADPVAFEKLWLGAAFELHNIENAQGFQQLTLLASRGEITEDDYVQAMFTLEFLAAQRTRRWYVEIFLPHAKKYQLPTNPLNWYCNEWGSADAIFALYTDKSAYPSVPYRRYYRELRSEHYP